MWHRAMLAQSTNPGGIPAMNMREARFRDAAAEKTSEQFFLDRGSFVQRTTAVAAAAAAEAEAVDRDARFPQAAIDAARQHRLLGVQIPQQFGGDGATIFDITEMCYTLGRACSSTAMIFAMHQTKVACLVRHGLSLIHISEPTRLGMLSYAVFCL